MLIVMKLFYVSLNYVHLRMDDGCSKMRNAIITDIKNMLDQYNSYTLSYRMIRDRFEYAHSQN